MPHQISISKLTPNLVVADVARSVAFYHDILGFSIGHTVPDAAPYVFASVESGPVEIFLNALEAASAEYPAIGERAIGGTLTLFLETSGISGVYAALRDRVTVVMPLAKKWYGVTEFAIVDPDGWIITFAERTRAEDAEQAEDADWSFTAEDAEDPLRPLLPQRPRNRSSFCFRSSSFLPASPSLPSAVSR